MDDPVSKALFWPFHRGTLDMPQEDHAESWLFLNARLGEGLDRGWRERLVCVQSDRALYEALSLSRFKVDNTRPKTGSFAGVLVRLGRDRQEARGLIANAWERVKTGGLMVVAGAKDDGAASHERDLAALMPLDNVMPKAGCRVFWLRKPEKPDVDLTRTLQEWRDHAEPAPHIEGGFFTQPGLFSWQSVDLGSRLLAMHLPQKINGRVADLGCGWGYLAAALLETCPAIVSLDLYEADAHALVCAKKNLTERGAGRSLDYRWHDVTRGLHPERRYDWIITNPPFHRGRSAEPRLGQSFIAAAAKALAPRGKLLLVANRGLPYERTLEDYFNTVETVIADESYKVLQASGRKPQETSSSRQRSKRR